MLLLGLVSSKKAALESSVAAPGQVRGVMMPWLTRTTLSCTFIDGSSVYQTEPSTAGPCANRRSAEPLAVVGERFETPALFAGGIIYFALIALLYRRTSAGIPRGSRLP